VQAIVESATTLSRTAKKGERKKVKIPQRWRYSPVAPQWSRAAANQTERCRGSSVIVEGSCGRREPRAEKSRRRESKDNATLIRPRKRHARLRADTCHLLSITACRGGSEIG
jgi:hypothetical protein